MLRTMRMLSWQLAVVIAMAIVSVETAADAEPGQGRGDALIPRGAYSIVAEVRAKPGKEAELRAATLPLIALVRSDPTNLLYFLQENRETPGHFVFYEIYATREDFEAHNNVPYVKEWFAKLPALADGGVKVMRMEILANRDSR